LVRLGRLVSWLVGWWVGGLARIGFFELQALGTGLWIKDQAQVVRHWLKKPALVKTICLQSNSLLGE